MINKNAFLKQEELQTIVFRLDWTPNNRVQFSIHQCFTLAYFALITFVFVLIKIVKPTWSDTNLVKTKSQIDDLLP